MQVGDVIGGKYQLLSKLGAGGTWVMWLALDFDARTAWMVKVLDKTSDTPGYLHRHEEEIEWHRKAAHYASDIRHPAFIPKPEGIIEDDHFLYVVMEYETGRFLSDIMRDRGFAFDEEDVIEWGIQLCEALHYLHSLTPPIIYCNMKPTSLMLQDDGRLRLEIEPDLMRRLGDDSDIAAGVPRYSSPEQLGAMGVDQRSDVYSLGVTLFNLVTAENPAHFAYVPPIRDINPELSPELERVICIATMQDPNRRWQSCLEMRHELERCRNLPNLPSRFKRHLLSLKGKLLG